MKIVDLFSGCGGLSLGLIEAGHDVVAALDNWEPAIAVYEKNFSHPVIRQDLSDVSGTIDVLKRFEIDLIAGGPPCQDFSSAGQRNHDGERADLTYKFADIVCAMGPTYFIMENVERIRKTRVFHDIVEQFQEAQYGLTAVVLNARDCGAPQARLRLFLIGHKGAQNQFLFGHLQKNLSEKPMSMRDYFGTTLGTEYYYRHPRNYNRRGIYGLDEPSATIRGVNRPIPPGYVLNSNDPQGISMSDVRPLTTQERARVQTFPEEFVFLGPKTSREQMIGNAVPVALGKYVGEALNDYVFDGCVPYSTDLTLFAANDFMVPERPLLPGVDGLKE